MPWARLLKFALDPRVLLGVGIAMLMAFAGVQTARLGHAKKDLGIARAAQIDPATHKPWQGEYHQVSLDLGTCQSNVLQLRAGIDTQTAAVTALKTESDVRTAAATKAAQSAHTALATALKYADALKAQKSGPDACASALNLLHQP